MVVGDPGSVYGNTYVCVVHTLESSVCESHFGCRQVYLPYGDFFTRGFPT